MQFLTSFKDLIVEFLRFIIRPNENINKSSWTLSSFFQIALFTLLLFIFFGLGSYLFSLTEIHIPRRNDFSLITRLQSIPFLLQFLVAVVIAPILEEISFRLPLKLSFKNAFISLASMTIAQLFFSRQSFSTLYLDHSINIEYARLTSILISFGFILLFVFIKKQTTDRLYWFYFYGMAFLFTVLHDVTNIHSLTDLFISFAFWFHAFVLALWTGFIRLKFGVLSSIVSHVQHNATVMVLIALFSN